jgi:dolichol-phosphate mannosyltransferase
MRALVVLPTYNELENLGPLVAAILDQGAAYDVLVVDDDSPDGTGILADHLKQAYPGRVEVIHRRGKYGIATAYLAGFRYAISKGYTHCFEMDADFSHDPAYLPKFLETMAKTGADLVLGSRYVDGGGVERWSFIRRWISQGGSLYARLMLGLAVRDLTGGFKCFRTALLERIPLQEIRSSGYAFQIELTYRAVEAGAKVVEMPIRFGPRRSGRSKMSLAIVAEAFWLVTWMRLAGAAGPERVTSQQRLRP